MDNQTELRRRINYVNDLIQKSERIIKGESKDDYYDFFRNYLEVIAYLNHSMPTDEAPKLIKPNIFNTRLGSVWTIALLGLLNPFVSIMILTLTFPVSFPYLIIRGIMLRNTKNRIEDCKIYLTGIVNKLKEQSVEMTRR